MNCPRNEIHALAPLLRLLTLVGGTLVTADAIGPDRQDTAAPNYGTSHLPPRQNCLSSEIGPLRPLQMELSQLTNNDYL